jgi:transcriptional regulator with XRE-family HTH domain
LIGWGLAMSSLIKQIIGIARQHGLTQKVLARNAGVPEATLSRAKRRDGASLGVVEALAQAAGARVAVIPVVPEASATYLADEASFRTRNRHLAWSNPNASSETLLRQALAKAEFQAILDASVVFGVERVEREWALLKASDAAPALRVAPVTDRILRNIHAGFQQAAA